MNSFHDKCVRKKISQKIKYRSIPNAYYLCPFSLIHMLNVCQNKIFLTSWSTFPIIKLPCFMTYSSVIWPDLTLYLCRFTSWVRKWLAWSTPVISLSWRNSSTSSLVKCIALALLIRKTMVRLLLITILCIQPSNKLTVTLVKDMINNSLLHVSLYDYSIL